MDREALRKAWGGPVAGDDRRAHHPEPDAPRKAEQLPAVQDQGRSRQRREGACRDAAVEVREQQRRLHGEGVQGRAPDRRRPRGRQGDAAGRPVGREEARDHVHRSHRSTVRTRSSRRRRGTFRSRTGRAGSRTTRTRRRSSTRCSYGANIIPSGNTNYSLVGIKPGQAGTLGIKGNVNNVPSIDALADRCRSADRECPSDVLREHRSRADDGHRSVDPVHVGEDGHIIGPNVTKWNFDQSSGFTAFAHVAVKS